MPIFRVRSQNFCYLIARGNISRTARRNAILFNMIAAANCLTLPDNREVLCDYHIWQAAP